MIAVMNRIPVSAENAEAFETLFATRAGLVDDMPGFISYRLLRPTKEGAPYIVMTFWEEKANFEAWTRSEAFKIGHARVGQLPRHTITGHPELEIHEIIQRSTEEVLASA